MQIIVLGTQRSGSSLVTRLLNMSGAYFGSEGSDIGFTRDKQKGFWERQDVVEINDALLKTQEASYSSVDKMKILGKAPTKKMKEEAEESLNKIKNVIEEMNKNDDWVMKDERLCLTLPYWKSSLDNPVVVMVSRCPEESIVSIEKRNHNSLAHASAMWEYYTVSMLNNVAKMKVVHVSHKELIEKPVKTLTKLLDDLSKVAENKLKLPSEEDIAGFVDKELWLTKIDKDEKEKLTTNWQQKLYSFALGKSEIEDKQVFEVSRIAKDAMEKYGLSVVKEEKLVRSNSIIARLDQMVNELSREIGEKKELIEELKVEHASELAAERENAANIEEPSFVCKIINIFGKKAA